MLFDLEFTTMSATATVTVLSPGSGNYKEPFISGPHAFNLENERKGTVDQPLHLSVETIAIQQKTN